MPKPDGRESRPLGEPATSVSFESQGQVALEMRSVMLPAALAGSETILSVRNVIRLDLSGSNEVQASRLRAWRRARRELVA